MNRRGPANSSFPRKREPSFAKRLEAKILGKITPIRIRALDQLKFPVAVPFLDSFLTKDRLLHRGMLFEPDEHPNAIFAREAAQYPVPVLVNARDEIGRDAGIKSPVAFRSQQIDSRAEFAMHGQSLLGSRFRGNDEVG